MHASWTIALSLTLLINAVVTDATPIQKRSSFKIRTKKHIDKGHRHAGHRAMLRAYKKYGFSTTSIKMQTSSNTTQTGTVQAVPEDNDAAFLSKVVIGGQALNLDFDTGSSDLWVFSTQLSQNTIGQHSAYDPQKSKTFTNTSGSVWSIAYGDGSGAAGNVGTDTVNIGGATVTQQVVEMATALSESFVQDVKTDGLVGLAFSKLNTVQPQPAKTFFDNVMPSLKLPVFSVDLEGDGTGTYDFGNIDLSKVRNQRLTNVPIDSSGGFWQFNSSSFAVDGVVMQNQAASPAIADTGTSLMIVDDIVALAYYSKVLGAQYDFDVGGYTYPCNAKLPDLSVAVGSGYFATIPGSDVTFAQVDQKNCFGGVQGNAGSNMQIFGDTFFKAQYVVFDGQNLELQLGPKV